MEFARSCIQKKENPECSAECTHQSQNVIWIKKYKQLNFLKTNKKVNMFLAGKQFCQILLPVLLISALAACSWLELSSFS